MFNQSQEGAEEIRSGDKVSIGFLLLIAIILAPFTAGLSLLWAIGYIVYAFMRTLWEPNKSHTPTLSGRYRNCHKLTSETPFKRL